MSVEAVRKVTIIVDVKPGEIVKPDVSWISAMSNGMKELVTEQNTLTEMVKKTHEESESLVKTQTEAIKVENELREQKSAAAKEAQSQAKDETDQHKKAIESKKKDQESYDEWFARTQAMYAENQRKLDEQAAARRADALKQQKQQQGGDAAKPFEIPAPNPRLPLRDPDDPSAFSRVDFREKQLEQQRERQQRADEADRQRRIQEHQKELAEIDRINAQEKAKQEQDERKLQEKKFAEAQRTFQKIKTSELTNVRERLEQEEAEQEKKAEAANRLFERIRKAEKTSVRERLQEEQDEEERKIEAANQIFQKIRKAEKTAVRERIQEEQEEEEKKIEAANRIFEKIRKAEKAAVRERIAEAEETFDKIREAELKHAKERREGAEKAEDDMPKHWRNVGLNAGQAVASVARYIGHMRMLKNVGGDSLEEIAKKFMTVQSRVETVSASTAAFTNFGTMIDGLEKAGTETAKVVAQQRILNQETTLTQLATMKLGNTAAAIAPMIAPMQFAFTAVTAAVVATDLAMDFLTESEEEAKQKANEWLGSFNRQLDEANRKLQTETDLIKGQSAVLIEQWEIKKLIAGEDGLAPDQIDARNEELRQRSDTESMRKIKTSVTEVFQSGLTEEQKTESGRLTDERKKATEELKRLKEELAYQEATEPTDSLSAQARGARRIQYEDPITRLEAKLRELDGDQTKFDLMTGRSIQESIGKTKISDGVVENFDELDRQLKSLPASMQESGKKMLAIIEQELVSGAQQNRTQVAEARQAARNAGIEKIQQETVLKDLTAARDDEAAVAERFKLTDSKFATEQVDLFLKQMEDPAATLDTKKMSVDNIRDVLSKQDLVTPDLAKVLDRGASAKPEEIRSALTDASEFTDAEQRDVKALIDKADAAIKKAESDALDMAAVADKLTRMLEVNSKQLNDLQKAIDARDGI
jgi:hypothetical protein